MTISIQYPEQNEPVCCTYQAKPHAEEMCCVCKREGLPGYLDEDEWYQCTMCVVRAGGVVSLT